MAEVKKKTSLSSSSARNARNKDDTGQAPRTIGDMNVMGAVQQNADGSQRVLPAINSFAKPEARELVLEASYDPLAGSIHL